MQLNARKIFHKHPSIFSETFRLLAVTEHELCARRDESATGHAHRIEHVSQTFANIAKERKVRAKSKAAQLVPAK